MPLPLMPLLAGSVKESSCLRMFPVPGARVQRPKRVSGSAATSAIMLSRAAAAACSCARYFFQGGVASSCARGEQIPS